MIRLRKKTISSQSILMMFFSGSTSVVTLVIFSFAARNLPVEDVANGVLIATFAWYLTSLLDFGGSTYSVREVVGERILLAAGRYFCALKICALLPLIVMGIFIFHNQAEMVIRTCALTFLLLATNVVTIEYRVEGFTSALSIIAFIEKISLLFALLLTIFFDLSYHFSDLMLFSNFISLCISVLLLDKKNFKFKRSNVKDLFLGSLGIGSSSAVTQIQIMDVNLLAMKIGTFAASPYILVTRWTNPLGMFSNIFSQAIAPIVAKKKLMKNEIQEIIKSSYLILFSIILCTLVALESNRLVRIFFGEHFESSGVIVRVLALATIFSTITQPLSTILQSRRNPWKVTIALIAGISIQFLSIFIFASDFGALSAAYGFFFGQIATASVLLFFSRDLVRKILKAPYDDRSY